MHAVWILVLASSLSAARLKVAVLDVQDVSGDQAAHARLLTQIIAGEVGRDGSVEVISSSQIRQMLGFERQKELLGCSDGACLAEIGGALGADYLISGELGKIGTRFRLDLNILDQHKARTAATRGDFLPAEEDALANATVSMVNDLLVKTHLRSAASAALAVQSSAPPAGEVSHTAAYVAYAVAVGLLAGAGVMTGVTHATYQAAVTDYSKPNVKESSNGQKLNWMSPLTDGLWAAGAIAAAGGTYLYLTAGPSGSGGEVGIGGRF